MAFALSHMQLKSSAFDQHNEIPKKYTGEGEDVSPALEWTDAPEGTKSFAVICHDPDAPLVKPGIYGFTHWVLYNLPSSTTRLEENTEQGTNGKTDFGRNAYGGPMPPEGHGVHCYYFWVLALSTESHFEEGLTLEQFLQKAEPHIIGMNRLVGTYRR